MCLNNTKASTLFILFSRKNLKTEIIMYSDEFKQAYKEADKMLENEEDFLMQEMLKNMSTKDQDTLRDRLADAMVFAKLNL